MDTPTPLQTSHLLGHDEALRTVSDAFQSGRMHHAWLIAGIEGIGKMTLAYHIAHHVLSGGENAVGKVDMNHRVARLISAEAHPDMLVVRRAIDEKTGELRNVIIVEDALKVASFLHKTSTHGGWRVVIVDEAQLLNRHGQNAILKILEEPPARTLILITVTTPGVLLPTIRSRCRVLQLAPLDDKHMKTALLAAAPDLQANDVDRLISLSGGSIGLALKIVRTETLPLYEQLMELLANMPHLDVPRLHKLADQISRKSDAESFEVLRALLLEHLRVCARAAAEKGENGRKLLLWEKISAAFDAADCGNLDRKLTFINAVNDIRAAA